MFLIIVQSEKSRGGDVICLARSLLRTFSAGLFLRCLVRTLRENELGWFENKTACCCCTVPAVASAKGEWPLRRTSEVPGRDLNVSVV